MVARYKTMQGYLVERKAGWDTHGLPVELGVEKALGISGKQEIENYGVEQFIQACKKSVLPMSKNGVLLQSLATGLTWMILT